MSKPFFYRIEAGALMDFATDEEGQGISLLRFAKELQKGQSDIAFIQGIIDEAHDFINQRSIAGKKGMEKRWSKKHKPKRNTDITNLNTVITEFNTVITNNNTPVTSSSNNKKQYRENVLLTDVEYDTLFQKHGKAFVEKCLDKLSSYKLANGKTYKSDYGAINQWVVEAVQKSLPQNKPTPDTNPQCVTPEWL
jgi:hypothetical protein